MGDCKPELGEHLHIGGCQQKGDVNKFSENTPAPFLLPSQIKTEPCEFEEYPEQQEGSFGQLRLIEGEQVRVLGEVVKIERVDEALEHESVEYEAYPLPDQDEDHVSPPADTIGSEGRSENDTASRSVSSDIESELTSSVPSPASQHSETNSSSCGGVTFQVVAEVHVPPHSEVEKAELNVDQNITKEPPLKKKRGRPARKSTESPSNEIETIQQKAEGKPKKTEHSKKSKGQDNKRKKQPSEKKGKQADNSQTNGGRSEKTVSERPGGPQVITNNNPVSIGTLNAAFQCTHCEKLFPTPRSRDGHFKTHLRCDLCQKTFGSPLVKDEHTCPKRALPSKQSRQISLTNWFRIDPKKATKKRSRSESSTVSDTTPMEPAKANVNGWELVRDDTGEVVDVVDTMPTTDDQKKSKDKIASSKDDNSPSPKKARSKKRRLKDENHMVPKGPTKKRRMVDAVKEESEETQLPKPKRKVLTIVETQVTEKKSAEKTIPKKDTQVIKDPLDEGTQKKAETKKIKRSKKHENEESECKLCGATFRNIGHLKNHIRSHKWNEPHICTTCGLQCSNAEEKSKHEKIHNAEKPFPCTECGASFGRKYFLDLHMRTHTGEKPFCCQQCGKAFAQSSHLKIHMKTHTGDKPYKCKLCDSAFVYASKLKEHSRTHSGERPYACKTCDRVFAQKYYLKVHQRTHSGERPFKCELCGVGFRQSCHVLIHMRTHTGEMPYSCKKCGKEFRHSPHLKKHNLTGCDSDAESTASSTVSSKATAKAGV